MSWTDPVGLNTGAVTVATTSNGGHPLEYYAERIVARLINISDTAPEPLKAQAFAYRNDMYQVVLNGLRRAIESDRAYRNLRKE